MKLLFSLLTVFASSLLAAQTTATNVYDSAQSSVQVHKDSRIDLLMAKQAQINEETSRNARRTAKGFRIMIISTSSREEALSAKTTIYANFPELKAYLWHQTPFYKLKCGNFKDRKEAESYQTRLNLYFPKGVYVISDVIEMKPGSGEEML
ncbi:MAG: SPOR domain-containing protein [Chitinophagaceae bacterium]